MTLAAFAFNSGEDQPRAALPAPTIVDDASKTLLFIACAMFIVCNSSGFTSGRFPVIFCASTRQFSIALHDTKESLVSCQSKTKNILGMASHTQELPLFSRRMKAARERLCISQMELGVRAGIDEFSSSARINQYERGKHAPDFLTATHLAKALGVPTAYFYAEDDNLAELIALVGQMKAAERNELFSFAESLISQAKTSKVP